MIGNPFSLCKLESIEISPQNANYKVDENVLYSRDGTKLICYPTGRTDVLLSVPEGTTVIGTKAFSVSDLKGFGSDLEQVVLPNSVSRIESEAFYLCRTLKRLELPETITYLGENAFWMCMKLEAIQVPDGIANIEAGQFENCYSLESVILPNSITVIEQSAFRQCESLNQIAFPDSVVAIKDDAFCHCKSLKEATIPASVHEIGKRAFSACPELCLIVERGSYAEQYAIENEINYQYVEANSAA